MNDNPFYVFIRLVELDQKLNKVIEQHAMLLEEIKALQAQQQELEENLVATRLRSQTLRKQVTEKEREIKVMRDQESAKKYDLEQLNNPREYFSLQQALDILSKKLADAENVLFDIWQQQQEAEKKYDECAAQYESFNKTIESQLVSKQAEKDNQEQSLERLKQERATLEPRVAQDFRDKYLNMLTKVSNPVVPVVNGVCTACFSPVSFNDLQSLKRHKLLACKDCYRLLYIV